MIVIKGIKSFLGGQREKYFVIDENVKSVNDEAENLVNTWAKNEPSARNKEFSVSWEKVMNPEERKNAISKEIETCSKQIDELKTFYDNLNKELEQL